GEQRILAEALRDTALALTSTLSVDAVLDRILEHAGRVVPHDAVTILLVDADGDPIIVTRRHGDRAHDQADAVGARFSLALMPTLSQMARTGQPVVIATTQTDDTWVDASAPRWVRSYVGAPIRIREHTVGFLTVASTTPGFFTDEHAERLQALAHQAAIAMEHARLYAEVETLAVADPLTGVANRRILFQIGKREVERALRNHTPLALIMLDLDHFKRINDTYGHSMGDQVLLAVAACCRNIVRDIDVVTRYGGEEFILLLPDTDMGEAAVVAERLRQAIERMVVLGAAEQHGFSPPIHVTVSLGVGALTVDTPTLEALIEQADRALYAAKHGGRNQVRCAEPGERAMPFS
ncbi:MAG: sensor domain-containing diguanylate cyclase, partial [Chloroflexia bacterium]|nr:sensor domain-containing diguanylate cyclase [Chloroflexia bacterium]